MVLREVKERLREVIIFTCLTMTGTRKYQSKLLSIQTHCDCDTPTPARKAVFLILCVAYNKYISYLFPEVIISCYAIDKSFFFSFHCYITRWFSFGSLLFLG